MEGEYTGMIGKRMNIICNQLGRRNLTPFVRSELALKLKGALEAKAKDRQKEHGGTAPGTKSVSQKSDEVISHR